MTIAAYHQRTKHLPGAYAKGPDSIDWDAQPDPFRRYDGAPHTLLPLAASPAAASLSWGGLWQAALKQTPPAAIRRCDDIAHLLELSLALSAWKQFGSARWSLRINPSSGNLHPTEAYVLVANIDGLSDGVYHYRADLHALEQRCRFTGAWPHGRPAVLLALTSLHWREAWKYGERAYRYCQHDVGHALAAISFAAATLNLGPGALQPLPVSDACIGELTGIGRQQDFTGAEGEHADALLSLSGATHLADWTSACAQGEWQGQASVVDPHHWYEWPLIDQAAALCCIGPAVAEAQCQPLYQHPLPLRPASGLFSGESAARIIRQRRSAQAFDADGAMRASDFFTLLNHCLPRRGTPWNSLPLNLGIHLLLFVHQVDGLPGGLYCLLRQPQDAATLQAALRPEFLWQPVDAAPSGLPLYLLLPAGTRRTAANLACQQAIAGDGAFSLAMLADMRPLQHAPWRYRHLLWQAGAIGQILYLEAESCGLRGTGIGCYYDDHVHQLLGLANNDWQVLYHFTVGLPLDDPRISRWAPYREREG